MIKHALMVTGLLMMIGTTGCQHIQLATNPMPITLTPNATQKAALANWQAIRPKNAIILQPTKLPIKNKSSIKKTTSEFYLLESWF